MPEGVRMAGTQSSRVMLGWVGLMALNEKWVAG